MRNLYKQSFQSLFLLASALLLTTSLYAQPANDDCANAITLNVGTACNFAEFTNDGATASNVPNPGCANYNGGDVWFKFTVPANGSIVLDATQGAGTMDDGAMALYTGTCGNLTMVACDDDNSVNGLMPYIQHSGLQPGSIAYVRFWEYDGNLFGTFSICASQTVGAGPCSTTNPAGCFCPTPGATDCTLLPDITGGDFTLNDNTGWFEHSQMITNEDKGLLRVDVSTPNVGWGPMEVSPTNDYICGGDTLRDFFPSSGFLCPDGSFPKRLINQRLYRKVGSTFEYILRPAGFMVYHPAHGHIHLDGWGQYTLRLKDVTIADTLQWPIVSSGIKVSFCLIDLSTCSGSPGDCEDANGNTLLNTDFPNYGLGGGYNCGNQKQGISVGKVDIYHNYLDESFVKIPYEACNGEYHVLIQIDPDNHFLEMREDNNWVVAKTPLTQQRTSNTGAYAYIFSKKGNTICTGETLQLEASGASSYTWNTGATTQKINITQPGRYWVRATTPCGIATSDTLDVFSAGASSFPSTTREDTVCIGTAARLYASGNAHWFDAPVGGNLLFIGNDFQTGTLNANTTFYVADQPPMFADSVGPERTNFSGTGNNTLLRGDYLIFNAFQPFKLKTVKVNASTAGNRTIQLRDLYGNVILSKVVTLIAGEQTVELNFFVPSGLNHQLGVDKFGAAPSLFASTTTASNIGYPYNLNAVARIVGSSVGDKFYPFFYNWQIEGIAQTCNDGSRKPVTAYVAPDVTPTITGVDPLYLHTSFPVTISVNPPGGTLFGAGINGNVFSPSAAGVGIHELNYTYAYGNCIKSATVEVEVRFDSSRLPINTILWLYDNWGPLPILAVLSERDSYVNIQIMNNTGQVIRTERFGAARGRSNFEIDLRKYPKGIYMINAIYGDGEVKKVFKVIR